MANSPVPRVDASTELPREVIALQKALATVPEEHRHRIATACDDVVTMVTRRRRVLALVQEALAQLRLDVKYLMFDLEVTRRERDELKTGGFEAD